jgi:hypothetical protein
MITNTGKEIVAKYMLGTAPAYASYMAFGCGAKPLGILDAHDFVGYSQKEVLDFEMFRVPISSRGYVYENNTNKLVFTAELPSQEKYEITEIGIYSAGSNPAASGFDSRNIVLFSTEENWQYVTTTPANIPQITTPLDSQDDNVIDVAYDVFQANSDNRTFYRSNRNDYHERCRFFNNMVIIAGDFSSIKDATASTNLSSVYHILKTGLSLNLSQNSLSDKIKIGFSLINKTASLTLDPTYDDTDKVKIIVDFINTSTKKARLVCEVNKDDDGVDFTSNRYYIIEKSLSDAVQDSGFSWQDVTSIKIYSCVVDGGVLSSDYYVGLDAIRVDNITTQNPLYGLVAYTTVKNSTEQPILKASNTNNYIEFRMALGVQ